MVPMLPNSRAFLRSQFRSLIHPSNSAQSWGVGGTSLTQNGPECLHPIVDLLLKINHFGARTGACASSNCDSCNHFSLSATSPSKIDFCERLAHIDPVLDRGNSGLIFRNFQSLQQWPGVRVVLSQHRNCTLSPRNFCGGRGNN